MQIIDETTDPKTVLTVISIVGLAVGWLLNAFRHGKKIGAQSERISTMAERLDSIEIQQKAFEHQWKVEREKLRGEMQADIKAVKALIETKHGVLESYFWDNNKNPRILTVTQHEKICGDRKQDSQEIKKHIEEIFTTMKGMASTVAVLRDRLERQ